MIVCMINVGRDNEIDQISQVAHHVTVLPTARKYLFSFTHDKIQKLTNQTTRKQFTVKIDEILSLVIS